MIEAIRPDAPGSLAAARQVPQRGGGSPGTFAAELELAQEPSRKVRFSAHAQQRLDDRRITLTDGDRARIAASADVAASKGAREAVLLMDRFALVMGVPNRTVITVMEPQAGEPAVFTNIDSVVVVPPEGG